MSIAIIWLAQALLFIAGICSAGRTHYYGGSGYPTSVSGYNRYQGPHSSPYGYEVNGYGLNGYGTGGYPGYQDYDSYDDEDYDVDNYGSGAYGGYGSVQYPYGGSEYPYVGNQYPYAYQKQILPAKVVSSPVVSEYVAPLPPISKSVSTSSLYQTHPTAYGNYGYGNYGYGNYGYGNYGYGNYGYQPKYGSGYGSEYYGK